MPPAAKNYLQSLRGHNSIQHQQSGLIMRFLSKSEWTLLICLFLFSFIPSFGGILRMIEIVGGPAIIPHNPRVIAGPFPVVIHVTTALSFCLLGALQFTRSIEQKAPQWHRIIGRTVAVSGVLSALTGLWMTHFYPLPPELQGALLYWVRIVLGISMVALIVFGWTSMRKRDTSRHISAMIRAYAIGQGASTQSLLGILWMLVTEQEAMGLKRDILMTAAWVINLTLAEFLIRKLHTKAHPDHTPTIVHA